MKPSFRSRPILRRLPRSALLLAVCVVATTAPAQWMTQTLNLQQGWNAVFLEVQPKPSDCDTIFSGQPIESVWMWNKRFNTVQYIADPNTLLPGQPDWLTYLPPNSTNRAVANLFALQGGRPYLIKATASTSVVIRGEPCVRNPDWLADSFNLVGFYVRSNSPPTFLSFFAPSTAHAGQPMYRLNVSGSWEAIISPSTTAVNPGACYWIRSAAPSTYSGPAKVIFEQGRTLEYGRALVEQTLRVRNASSNATTFTLKQLASGAPLNTNYPALAGDVPLSYWRMNLASNEVGWVPLPATLTSASIPAGGEWSLRLAVRRTDMSSFSLPVGYSNALYQSLLEVTDTVGSRYTIPVSANGLQTYASAAAAAFGGPAPQNLDPPPDPRAGLWIGSVVLDNVNQAGVSTNPTPTASQFQFRLIVHVDASGDARLMQKVVLAWTNGVYATNQLGIKETVTPGRYVLVTDENLLSRFSGSAIRDGIVTGQRFSSAAFSFRQPILMNQTTGFGQTNGTFSCAVPLGYNDELNPFKHKYHPDHNNLDDRYESTRQEALNVTRQISLQFTAADPDNGTLAGWGDNQLGGNYGETITGLHKYPINTSGTFRLFRASSVAVLNDGSF